MPLDRGLVDQQLEALGEGSRWWNHRELRDLPAVLHTDEQILAIARGKLARLRWLRRSWLMVVTERRLLCLRSGSGSGWRQVEVSAARITRVALRVGPFRGRVIVADGGHGYRLLVPRADAYRVHAALAKIAPGEAAATRFAPGRVVRRVFDHVLALPAAALDPQLPAAASVPAPDTSHLEQRVQLLETEVQELREQVDFLEQLLRERQQVSLPTGQAR